jgi:hypothetical protein
MRVVFSTYQRNQSRAINVVIETFSFDPLTNRIHNSDNQRRNKISCENKSECDCGFDLNYYCLSQHEDGG